MNEYIEQLEEENEKLRKALADEIKKKEVKKEDKNIQDRREDFWVPRLRYE